jgi:hypothetical protein
MRIRLERALEEQPHGRVCRQRLDGVHVLAPYMKHRAAGDENAQARRMREQVGEERCRLAHVLGVVEQEQQLARLQRSHQRLGQPLAGGLRDRERSGDCGGNERSVVERREPDEDGAVRERAGKVSRELERESRLAGAAGAAERQQADVLLQEQ